MDFLVVVLIILVAVLVGIRAFGTSVTRPETPEPPQPPKTRRADPAPLRSSLAPTPSGDPDVPSSVGAIGAGPVAISETRWRVNPGASFALSFAPCNEEVAERIARALAARAESVEARVDVIEEAMLADNVRCVELDAYLDDLRARVTSGIERLRKASTEYQHAGPADREDLDEEFLEETWESLTDRPSSYFEEARDVLLAPPPSDATFDDALLARYGRSLLRDYFDGPADRVVTVGQEFGDLRERMERLVDAGLMMRGAAIPAAELVAQLKMADMRALVADLNPPKWTRRAQAIAYLEQVDDLTRRLGERMPLRSLFKRLPLPDEFASLDLTAVSLAWRQARAHATLVLWAYSASDSLRLERAERRVSAWYPDVYEVCCDVARRYEGADLVTRRELPKSWPPHFGCCVRLQGSIE